jgi:hypothetical protein
VSDEQVSDDEVSWNRFRTKPIKILNQYDFDMQHSAGHLFSTKVTSGRMTEEKATPPMLFYGILCAIELFLKSNRWQ